MPSIRERVMAGSEAMRAKALAIFFPTGIMSKCMSSPYLWRSPAIVSRTPLNILTLYAPQRPSSLPRTTRATFRTLRLGCARGELTGASEERRLAMIVRTPSPKGTSRRSTPSALCILAEEIIFIAPVIFSEEATEPMRPLSSRNVAIVIYLKACTDFLSRGFEFIGNLVGHLALGEKRKDVVGIFRM